MKKIKSQKNCKKNIFFTLCMLLVINSYSQKLNWKTENGWALRETAIGSNSYERYFPIGVNNIPDYETYDNNHPQDIVTPHNETVFSDAKLHFNTFLFQSGQWDDYTFLDNSTLIAGMGSVPDKTLLGLTGTPMENMKTILSKDAIEWDNNINTALTGVQFTNRNRDFIWTTIDEPADGADGWCWPPSFTDRVYQRIQDINTAKDTKRLVFLNLTGSLRGNVHFFNKMKCQIENNYSPKTCLDNLYPSLQACNIYTTFYKSIYDGTPRFISSCPYNYDEKYIDNINTTGINYLNTQATAYDYRNSYDIVGLDAYDEFYNNPKSVGLAVNALKSGSGGKPIWVYFDGNGYYPTSIDYLLKSNDIWIRNIKCQIYTAIVNGATGILFWNNPVSTTTIYDKTKLLADELKDYERIIKGENLTSTNFDEDLQYVIKQTEDNKEYIIAVNTGLTSQTLNVAGFPVKILQPYEVFISPKQPKEEQFISLFSNGLNFIDNKGGNIIDPKWSSLIDIQKNDFSIEAVKFAVPGDYNGDGKQDIALFYNQNSDAQRVLVLLSDGSKYIDQNGNPVINPRDAVWINASVDHFNLSAVKFVTSGDFNGDGKDDLCYIYDQNSSAQRIVVLLSDGQKFINRWGETVADPWINSDVWIAQSTTNFNIANIKTITSGKFNNDGKSDLAIFYNQNDNAQRIFILLSDGVQFKNREGLIVSNPVVQGDVWIEQTKTEFNLNNLCFVTSGDYDGDGKSDIALLYNQNNLAQRIIILLSNGIEFKDQNNTIVKDVKKGDCWISIPQDQFNLLSVRHVTSSDFDGDGKSDIALLYDQNELAQRFSVLLSNGTHFKNQWGQYISNPRDAGWLDCPRTMFDFTTSVKFLTSGKFNNDEKSDLVLLYDNSNSIHENTNYINGETKLDLADNCSPVINLPNIMVKATALPSGKEYYGYSNNSEYEIWLPPGNYNVSPVNTNNLYISKNCPSAGVQTQYSNVTSNTKNDFYFNMTSQNCNLSITTIGIYPSPLGSPCPIIPYKYCIHVKNNGQPITNGSLTVTVDQNVTIKGNETSTFYTGITHTNHTLTASFATLNINEETQILIDVEMGNEGLISPPRIITTTAEITGTCNSGTVSYSSSPFTEKVECSQDPNDKMLMSPIGCGTKNNISKTEDQIYQIRFQNVGNALAHNVLLRDKLDNNFDLSTFKVMSTSHDITSLQIIPDNELIVKFDNIQLPSSGVNLNGSNGFIVFSIKPKQTVADGTIIRNQAEVYFDLNSAIMTNSVESTLWSEPKPTASFTNSHSCNSSGIVNYNFTNTGSTDNVTYSWSFGSGATPTTSAIANPTGITFNSSGWKVVTLTVDRNGCTSLKSDSILVNIDECRCATCNKSISGNSWWQSDNDGQVICVPQGQTLTAWGSINHNNVKIVNCGTIDISNIWGNATYTIENYGTLIYNGSMYLQNVTINNYSTGTVTVNGALQVSSNTNFTNNSTINVTGQSTSSISGNAHFVNQSNGVMIFASDLSIDGWAGCTLTNDGIINVNAQGKQLQMQNACVVTNTKTINAYNVNINWGPTLNNYCQINVSNNWTQNSTSYVHGPTDNRVGRIDVAGYSTFSTGTFGGTNENLDFCDAGHPTNHWDVTGGTVLGNITYCSRNSTCTNCNLVSSVSTSDADICKGESTTLSATGGTTYHWNTGATTQGISVSPIANTTYTVTISQNSCSVTQTIGIAVTVPSANAGSDQIICNGSSASLTATGGGTYYWNTGSMSSIISVSPTTTTTFTVTTTTNGCTATDDIVVTVNQEACVTCDKSISGSSWWNSDFNGQVICVPQGQTLSSWGNVGHSNVKIINYGTINLSWSYFGGQYPYTIENHGSIVHTGDLTVSGITLSNLTDATITVNGNLELTSSGQLTNEGTLNVNGTGSSAIHNGMVVMNSTGGTMNFQSNLNIDGSDALFTNNGIVNVNATGKEIFITNSSNTISNNNTINAYNFRVSQGAFSNNCSLNVSNNWTQDGSSNIYGPTGSRVGRIDVAGVSTFNYGSFGATNQNLDFCDAGNPTNHWDVMNGTVAGNVTYCTRNAQCVNQSKSAPKVNYTTTDISSVNNSGNKVFVYPNPARNELTIEYHLVGKENLSFSVNDLIGKVVLNFKINDKQSGKIVVPLSELSAGTYLYRISSNNQIIKFDKLIIIK